MAQQLRIDVRLPQGHWAGDVTRQHPSATLRIEQHMPLSKGRGTARCWSNEDLCATVQAHDGIDACTDAEDGRFSVNISAGGGGFLRPLVDRGEFSVALYGDHADEGIPHALVGHLKGALPLGTPSIVAEFDDVASTFPVKLNGEVKISHPFTFVANVVLPGFEVLNPVVPRLRKVVHANT